MKQRSSTRQIARAVLATCCGVVALFGGHARADFTIDFDDLSAGTIVTNQYASAALFSSSAGHENYAVAYGGPGAVSPPNVLGSGATGTVSFQEDTYIAFTEPLFDLWFFAIFQNAAAGVVAQFKVFENQVHTATVPLVALGEVGNRFIDLSQYDQITRLEIVEISQPVGFDLFTLRPVPEPTTFITVSLLVLVIRRRQLRGD